MLPRTGAAATAWANRQYVWPVGKCLQFTRLCFNVAAKYPDARSAWRNAKHKHGVGVKRPPAGVWVFFDSPNMPHGHSAYSVGYGNCRTTDYPDRGRIATVPIVAIERGWNCDYKGWAEDINDVRIWRPPLLDLSDLKKCAETEPGHRLSQHPAQVKALARALHREGLLSAVNVTGHYSFAKKRAYANWQRRLGYTGNDANGIPGAKSLARLCAKYGYDFRP